MKKFEGLHSLLCGLVDEELTESVFVNPEQLKKDPIHADYFIFPQKEVWEMDEDSIYDDESGNILPVKFRKKNLRCWMQIAHIEKVVVSLNKRHCRLDMNTIANVLTHQQESM